MRERSPKQKVAEFHRAVRSVLEPLADAERAAGARAYMRDKFDYLGISTPARRGAAAPLIKAFKPSDAAELRKAADGLWKMREREYQYVAADLLARCHAVLSLEDLPWLLDLAQEKSWWDTVDCIVKVVGKIVRRSGVKGQRAMNAAETTPGGCGVQWDVVKRRRNPLGAQRFDQRGSARQVGEQQVIEVAVRIAILRRYRPA